MLNLAGFGLGKWDHSRTKEGFYIYLIQYFRRCLNEENNEFFFHSDINLAYLYIFVIYIYFTLVDSRSTGQEFLWTLVYIICTFTHVFID